MMKKTLFIIGAAAALLSSCGGNSCKCNCNCPGCACQKDSTAIAAKGARGDYRIADRAQTDISALPVDDEGYIVIFNGENLDGWRGYGMDAAPTSWNVDDGAIHLVGSGTGEAQMEGGGDLIFPHKFKKTSSLSWNIRFQRRQLGHILSCPGSCHRRGRRGSISPDLAVGIRISGARQRQP